MAEPRGQLPCYASYELSGSLEQVSSLSDHTFHYPVFSRESLLQGHRCPRAAPRTRGTVGLEKAAATGPPPEGFHLRVKELDSESKSPGSQSRECRIRATPLPYALSRTQHPTFLKSFLSETQYAGAPLRSTSTCPSLAVWYICPLCWKQCLMCLIACLRYACLCPCSAEAVVDVILPR